MWHLSLSGYRCAQSVTTHSPHPHRDEGFVVPQDSAEANPMSETPTKLMPAITLPEDDDFLAGSTCNPDNPEECEACQ